MDIKELLTDQVKEEEGVWVDIDIDAQIKVARLFNDRFTRMMAAARRPYGRKVEQDTTLQEKLLVEVMAECILLDWKGLTEDGKELKFSKKRGLELMQQSRDFRNIVTQAATDAANFHADEVEEDAKN